MAYNVAVDVGGTFTDVLVFNEGTGELTDTKVLSTTEDPSQGVVTGIERVCEKVGISFADLRLLFHGTTVVTNMILTNTGARVGLLTTHGHEQILHLARAWTPGPLYGWMQLDKLDPPANLSDTVGINERLGADGGEIQALDEEEVYRAVEDLVEKGVEALAIGFLNSYVNPDHERRVRDIVQEMYPDLPVTIDTTAEYLEGRTERVWSAEHSDPDAEFARKVRIDLGSLSPLIALPHSPGNVVTVEEAKGRKIDQIYIGNCANGTMTDLRQTAEMLRGRKVHPDTRAVIVPASQKVYREAMAEGLLDLFVEAGAVVSTPTCGACFGGHMGVMAEGEMAITTTNRNFKGRMGSTEAEVHIANAYVAGAAAVAGEIVDPADVLEGAPV